MEILRFFMVVAASATFLSVPAWSASDSSAGGDDKTPFENFLDCTAFTWMHNCKTLNKWVSENPDKPVKINKDGIEWFFPPGTPSVTVDWVVNQTPQALERYMQYLERSYAHHKKASVMYQAALETRGGSLRGFEGIDSIRDNKSYSQLPKFNQSNAMLYVFYDSNCGACKQLEPNIAELRRLYPNLQISMLQINPDPGAIASVRAVTGAKVAQLSGAQLEQYKSRLKITPTIWVEDTRTKRTDIIEGYVTVPELVRHIAKVAK